MFFSDNYEKRNLMGGGRATRFGQNWSNRLA
jgi:hypothetical protein